MKQFEVKISDKVEFKFVERLTGIDYGVLIGIVQNIKYPYEHEWDDIQIACEGYDNWFEVRNDNIIKIIKCDEC